MDSSQWLESVSPVAVQVAEADHGKRREVEHQMLVFRIMRIVCHAPV